MLVQITDEWDAQTKSSQAVVSMITITTISKLTPEECENGLETRNISRQQGDAVLDCENLFAADEICNTFRDNTTAETHAAGIMSYTAADGIQKYLKSPGPLVTA